VAKKRFQKIAYLIELDIHFIAQRIKGFGFILDFFFVWIARGRFFGSIVIYTE